MCSRFRELSTKVDADAYELQELRVLVGYIFLMRVTNVESFNMDAFTPPLVSTMKTCPLLLKNHEFLMHIAFLMSRTYGDAPLPFSVQSRLVRAFQGYLDAVCGGVGYVSSAWRHDEDVVKWMWGVGRGSVAWSGALRGLSFPGPDGGLDESLCGGWEQGGGEIALASGSSELPGNAWRCLGIVDAFMKMFVRVLPTGAVPVLRAVSNALRVVPEGTAGPDGVQVAEVVQFVVAGLESACRVDEAGSESIHDAMFLEIVFKWVTRVPWNEPPQIVLACIALLVEVVQQVHRTSPTEAERLCSRMIDMNRLWRVVLRVQGCGGGGLSANVLCAVVECAGTVGWFGRVEDAESNRAVLEVWRMLRALAWERVGMREGVRVLETMTRFVKGLMKVRKRLGAHVLVCRWNVGFLERVLGRGGLGEESMEAVVGFCGLFVEHQVPGVMKLLNREAQTLEGLIAALAEAKSQKVREAVDLVTRVVQWSGGVISERMEGLGKKLDLDA
ncbi:hypothetical protein HDU98_011619 [Podochytrium sp. JEL0797]|nr:hypothetical protein HDU98_011619 [Podochytrium sp. JEL0797]